MREKTDELTRYHRKNVIKLHRKFDAMPLFGEEKVEKLERRYAAWYNENDRIQIRKKCWTRLQ